MKKEEIDQLITQSLSQEEAEFYKELDEENIFKSWGGLYTGKNAWLAIIQSIFILVFVVVAAYCVYHFYSSNEVVEMLQYGAGLIIAFMAVAMLKIWAWMQMDKNSILREIKRIEYQVALLMEKKAHN